jgi:hypothetical protein
MESGPPLFSVVLIGSIRLFYELSLAGCTWYLPKEIIDSDKIEEGAVIFGGLVQATTKSVGLFQYIPSIREK